MGGGPRAVPDFVFPSLAVTPLGQRNVLRSFDALIEKAAVRKIRLHDLRHTHASHLLLAGVHPQVVSERLSHASVAFTLRTYSHLLPTLQEGAADMNNRARGTKRGTNATHSQKSAKKKPRKPLRGFYWWSRGDLNP